jgi:hypothetical protein
MLLVNSSLLSARIDDNFFKKTPDGALVHRYKGDKQPVNLINSASNEMVAKESRDDYYAEKYVMHS